MNPRTTLAAILMAALLSGGVAACGGGNDGGDDGSAPDGEQTTDASGGSNALVVGIPATPAGVDLDLQTGPQVWLLAAQVFDNGQDWARVDYPFEEAGGVSNDDIEGFTYPDFANRSIEPALLDDCTLEDDGRTAIYTLREGVESAYGNEFTSADVIWRVERAIANEAVGAFMLQTVGAGDASQWEAVDDYTVEITSDDPMPLACDINTNQYWVYYDSTEAKKHATDEDPWANEWLATNGAGFGAYQIEEWSSGRQVVMTANPNYWRGAPDIERIIFRVVPDESARLALLRDGSLDIAEGLSPQSVQSLESVENVNPIAVKGNSTTYLVMNNAKPPFDDARVRQAVNLAIPREEIAAQVYYGLASTNWQGVLPSAYPGYAETTDYTYDLDRARALMQEAGMTDGFSTQLIYNAGDPVQESTAVLLRDSLQQIGIEVTPVKQPTSAWSETLQSKEAEFAIAVEFPVQPDINYALRLAFFTDNVINYQNYSSPEVDRIIEEGTSVVDPQERVDVNQQAVDIVRADAPVGWITEPYYLNAASSRVAGFGWYTTQYYRVADMSLQGG